MYECNYETVNKYEHKIKIDVTEGIEITIDGVEIFNYKDKETSLPKTDVITYVITYSHDMKDTQKYINGWDTIDK
jgi:hypothetical protein